MTSEDLLKKAIAAFKALSPEQQAEMLEEQRQSWVRGNVGLSRDERGMTSPVMPRPTPVMASEHYINSYRDLAVNAIEDLKNYANDERPERRMVSYREYTKDLQRLDNTRPAPAATDTGLEPVAWNCTYPSYGHFTLKEHEAKHAVEEGATVQELCLQSQAEKLLAAERGKLAKEEAAHTRSLEERDRYHDVADKLAQAIADRYESDIGEHSSINDPWQNTLNIIEADNAKQAARIKELEERARQDAVIISDFANDVRDLKSDLARINGFAQTYKRHKEALEAKLAVANDLVVRAQVIIPDHYVNWHRDARAVLGGKPL